MVMNSKMMGLNESSAGSIWQENRPMTLLVGGCLLFLAICAIGLLTDSTQIAGERAWIKPTKFGLSIGIYGATMLWMMLFLGDGRQRWVKGLAWVASIALLVELGLVAIQAIRGVRSHYNFSTAFDEAVYSSMGTLIFCVWVITFIFGVMLMRRDIQPVALGDGIRWGVLISCIGMALAFPMTSPTAQQMASLQAGESLVEIGAHTVGAEDGGAGLPFVGWSTEGGDLRIGHFLGLHGMQVIPLLGLWLMNKPAVSKRDQRRLVALAGIGYIGFTLLTTWQALRGQSIIAPDSVTILAFIGLIAAIGIPFLLIYRNNYN